MAPLRPAGAGLKRKRSRRSTECLHGSSHSCLTCFFVSFDLPLHQSLSDLFFCLPPKTWVLARPGMNLVSLTTDSSSDLRPSPILLFYSGPGVGISEDLTSAQPAFGLASPVWCRRREETCPSARRDTELRAVSLE